MNRNRFICHQQLFNSDHYIYHNSFRSPANRFNLWPQNLPINQINYPTNQPKNYCSTCDLWTIESYENHQISASHQAKKGIHRSTQDYINLPSNPNNNVNNSNVIGNILSKRNFKRRNRRNRNSQQKKIDPPIDSKMSSSRKNDEMTSSDERAEKLSDCDDTKSNEIKFVNSNTELSKNSNKGQEMLIPVCGVFCALCEIFFPEKEIAETEHCSSQSHCEAYEKLLKKVKDSKVEKRPLIDSTEDKVVGEAKRWKLSENNDRDFRALSKNQSNSERSKIQNSLKEIVTAESEAVPLPSSGTGIDSDETDRVSSSEFVAPDFSLEFPDEDYDEAEVVTNHNDM